MINTLFWNSSGIFWVCLFITGLWVLLWLQVEELLLVSEGMDEEVMVHIQTHNGILLSHERWNTDICDSMDGSWGFYANWNKSEGKRLYYMISLCDIWNKNKNKIRTIKITNPHRGRQQISGYQRGRGWREGEMSEGGQLCDDGWKLDFWLCARCIHRCQIIILYF